MSKTKQAGFGIPLSRMNGRRGESMFGSAGVRLLKVTGVTAAT
jgi:hypothetical protein